MKIEDVTDKDTIKAGIKRLSESKAVFDEEASKTGYEDGVKWALNDADYQELLSLNNHFIELGEIVDSDNLIAAIGYDYEFFNEAPENDCEEYIKSFVEGALEVFNKI